MYKECKQNIVAYSIDAGFHVFLFVLKENLERVKDALEPVKPHLERIIHTSIGREGVSVIN
jgi:mevalonate pyrophosphate decarboxylase